MSRCVYFNYVSIRNKIYNCTKTHSNRRSLLEKVFNKITIDNNIKNNKIEKLYFLLKIKIVCMKSF